LSWTYRRLPPATRTIRLRPPICRPGKMPTAQSLRAPSCCFVPTIRRDGPTRRRISARPNGARRPWRSCIFQVSIPRPPAGSLASETCRGRDRYGKHRLRSVHAVRVAPCARRTRHPHLREPDPTRLAAADGLVRRGVADEDWWWQRRTAARSGYRAGSIDVRLWPPLAAQPVEQRTSDDRYARCQDHRRDRVSDNQMRGIVDRADELRGRDAQTDPRERRE
jgi:hypothetical protein